MRLATLCLTGFFIASILTACGGGSGATSVSVTPNQPSSTSQGASTANVDTTDSSTTSGSNTSPPPTTTELTSTVVMAPPDGAQVSGVIHVEIHGSGIENAELLPANGHTPIYGVFSISAEKSVAALDFDTKSLPDGSFTVRVSIYDKPPRQAGAREVIAMTERTWQIRNGQSPSPALSARFNSPWGITIDSGGNLYVADSGNYTVRKITPSGTVSTLAGAPGQFSGSGSDMGTLGDGTGSAARFSRLTGITVDQSGTLYVADTFGSSGRIRQISPGGQVTTLATQIYALGIVSDRVGNLYLARNGGSYRIEKMTLAGNLTPIATVRGPRAVALDRAGNIVVADTGPDYHALGMTSFTCAIESVSQNGAVTVLAGRYGPSIGSSCGFSDGVRDAAKFSGGDGVAVDSLGNIYVADTGNHVIRKISPSGEVSTLAGSPTNAGSTDGTGPMARFNMPRGIVIDSADNLFVADSNNHTIRKITILGEVTTIAGAAGQAGSIDSMASSPSAPATPPTSSTPPAPSTPSASSTPPTPNSATIQDRVDGAFDGWKGDTVVTLRNGQVWKQAEYWYEYHYAYAPNVTIYESNGHTVMQVDGVSRAVAVERVR